jgi:hypothetical protein
MISLHHNFLYQVQSGDILVAVNGRNVRGCSIQAVAQLILGPIGSSVSLFIILISCVCHSCGVVLCFAYKRLQCHMVLRRKGVAFNVSASRKRAPRN